jgi:hypothetical protein
VICEVVLAHIKDEVLNDEGKIDPNKLDAVARMGGDLYCRASGNNLFRLPQPSTKIGLGIDQLPEAIRNSNILTGNDLGMLAGVEKIPLAESSMTPEIQLTINKGKDAVHSLAHQYLKEGKVEEAWKLLMI